MRESVPGVTTLNSVCESEVAVDISFTALVWHVTVDPGTSSSTRCDAPWADSTRHPRGLKSGVPSASLYGEGAERHCLQQGSD